MTKSFKALVAGLCSLAVLATGCTDKPAPEVPSAEAAVVSAEATTATIKLTTKLISEYAYVVRTDATQADDAAIIFLEGTTGTEARRAMAVGAGLARNRPTGAGAPAAPHARAHPR